MRRGPSMLLTATAAVIFSVPVVAGSGCEAKVYGRPPTLATAPPLTVVAPQGTLVPLPDAPPNEPTAAFEGLDARDRQATAKAANDGADISTVVLDRNTNQLVSNGNGTTIAIASVAKLFIADDVLLQESKGEMALSPADHAALDTMLRSSDDNAAEDFWSRGGGGAIISRVAARYGLRSTASPSNGRWWNTISTAADLVRYYDMLLDGPGGLPPERASTIIGNLAQST